MPSVRVDGISLSSRLVLAGVFAVFGVAKLADIDQTIRSVRAYQLLPEAVVPTVGTALPLLEILVAALLLIGLLTRATAVIACLLSLAFIIGIATAWARGLSIECGCFGNGGYTPDPVPGYLRELAINTVIIAGGLWLAAHTHHRFALDSSLGLTSPPHPVPTHHDVSGGPVPRSTHER